LNPFGTEEFVQFRQVFGLRRFKLHRHFSHGTVKSVWFIQALVYSGFTVAEALLKVNQLKVVIIIIIMLFKEYLKLLNRLYDITWFGSVYA
jgi:hypothetical protein